MAGVEDPRQSEGHHAVHFEFNGLFRRFVPKLIQSHGGHDYGAGYDLLGEILQA
jgi:hypothetical protein